jgi:hypothetical protein
MAASKFTPEIRGALIERFAADCSLPDAANAVELNEKTLRGWLTRGRKDEVGPYSDFAKAVDEAKEEARNRPDPMDEDELRLVVSESARKGNTQAMKLLWEILRTDRGDDADEEPADPLDALEDELSQRRAARAA